MPSVLSQYKDDLFYRVKLRIKFRDLILAGIPRAEKMLDYFMSERHMSDAERSSLEARISEGKLTEDEKEKIKNISWCKFESDADGNLCLWHGNVKAMLREMFTTLGLTQRQPNKKKDVPDKDQSAGGRQTFQHAVHVEPLYLCFERANPETEVREKIKAKDGSELIDDHRETPGDAALKRLNAAYGFVDRVKHIEDAAGRRSALGRHDYLRQPELEFTLMWPARGCFTEDDVKTAMAAAENDGLGACRSQGFGKFEVISWKIENAPKKKSKPKEEENETADAEKK